MVDTTQDRTAMLNIKNPDTYALARQVAARTGESLTAAVTTALRERLERLEATPRHRFTAEELLEIGRACADQLAPADRTASLTDDLYDADGLPR